jgi:hypothetical protein
MSRTKKNKTKEKRKTYETNNKHRRKRWQLLTLKGKLNCPGSHGDDKSWTRSTCSALAVVDDGCEWPSWWEDGERSESEFESVQDEWDSGWDEEVRGMSGTNEELWFNLCGSGEPNDRPIKLSAKKATITLSGTLSVFPDTTYISSSSCFYLSIFSFVSFVLCAL